MIGGEEELRNASGKRRRRRPSQSDLEEPVWYLGAPGMIPVLAKQ